MIACKNCGKPINMDDSEIALCDGCLFVELKKIFPNIKEDVIFVKQADGTYKEVEIIRGLRFKK